MSESTKDESPGRAKAWAKRIGLGVLALIVLSCAAYSVVYAITESRINKTYKVEPRPLEVKPSPEMVERGKEVATFRGCRDCHGSDFSGRVVADGMPIMKLVGPNITPAGVTADYTDEDWARAVRHGLDPDHKPLLFMPSFEWTTLSHTDMAALIAYARSVEPVEEPAPAFELGPVGRILYIAGKFPLLPVENIDHSLEPESPEPGPTVAYGRYLGTGCTGCHGKDLAGGPIPGVPPDWPPAPNLTPHESGLEDWTYGDFYTALREGKRPDGSEINEQYMPWKLYRESSDEDIKALWLYTQSLDPTPYASK